MVSSKVQIISVEYVIGRLTLGTPVIVPAQSSVAVGAVGDASQVAITSSSEATSRTGVLLS